MHPKCWIQNAVWILCYEIFSSCSAFSFLSLFTSLFHFDFEHDYISRRPGISEVEVDYMCDTGKVIEELSRSYESAIKAPATNLVYGSLVQMLLIQVQFLKYEILQSMEKVDLLVKANIKNIELAATVFFSQSISCSLKIIHLTKSNFFTHRFQHLFSLFQRTSRPVFCIERYFVSSLDVNL